MKTINVILFVLTMVTSVANATQARLLPKRYDCKNDIDTTRVFVWNAQTKVTIHQRLDGGTRKTSYDVVPEGQLTAQDRKDQKEIALDAGLNLRYVQFFAFDLGPAYRSFVAIDRRVRGDGLMAMPYEILKCNGYPEVMGEE